MGKTNLKVVEKNRGTGCQFDPKQLDEVNWKIRIALSTLDMIQVLDRDAELYSDESIVTLASEAYDRLIEARDILNPEVKEAK